MPNASVRTTRLPMITSGIYGRLQSFDCGPSYENMKARCLRLHVVNNDGVALPIRMPFSQEAHEHLQTLVGEWVSISIDSITFQDYLGTRPKPDQIEDQRVALNATHVARAI